MSFTNNKKDLLAFINNKPFSQIKTEFKEKKITVKENDNLYLLYSDIQNPENDVELHNQCNGIILEKETNNIICSCQNKIIQTNDYKNILKDFDPKDIQVEYCEDGTVMRLYYYNNEWFIATTRCIDATNSFWISNKNYKDLFYDVFKADLNTFDTNKTFIFILVHTENRLVIPHSTNKLIYLSNIDNNSCKEVFYSNCESVTEDTTSFSKIQQYKEEDNLKENDSIFDTKRGMIYRVTIDDSYIILLHDFLTFQKNKRIRGNNNRIHFRYLEILIKNPEYTAEFYKSYPEYAFLFSSIHHSLNLLVDKIHTLYIKSHVKHTIKIDNTHLYYKTLMHLHSIYKKEGKIITKDEVVNALCKLNVPVIARLLKWDLSKNKKTNTNEPNYNYNLEEYELEEFDLEKEDKLILQNA
jgi:hypothetical protein